MEKREPSYEELKRRLNAAESALQALREGQVDTVLGDKETLVVRLAEAGARENHIKQVLLAIRNVNQLIVREHDPGRLIESACASLTETLGYYNAWIALFDDSHKTVTMTASSGFDGGFEILRDLLKRGEYPTCMKQTLEQDTLVVVKNPPAECHDCPLAKEYAGRAGLTHRLAYGDNTYGILSVSVPGNFAFDAEEQDLFNELAEDLAFALHKIEIDHQIRRLNQIVTTIPQPMSFVSRDYRYLAVNDIYTEFYGTSQEQILGRTMADFCGVDLFEREIKPHLDRCLAGETVRYEVQVDFPTKDTRWMDMEYVPYQDEKGEVTGVISHGRDITEHKRAAEARERSRSLLQATLESTADGILVVDQDGRWSGFNRRFVEMWNVPGQICDSGDDKAALDYVFPQLADPEKFIATVREIYDAPEKVTFDTIKLKDGKVFERYSQPQRLGNEIVGRVWSFRDVTDRKRAEDRLRESEQQKNLILNSGSEMVAYYDTDLRIIWANRASGKSVGKSHAELIGHHCYEIWHQRTDPCPGCPVLEARDTKRPQKKEQQTPDGRHWYLRGYPIFDEEENVVALVEFGQDISERKRAEEENERLEMQVRQAQKLESIGRLAGGVAHDLNNLLAPILGYGEMLLEDTIANDPRKEPIQEIVNAGVRARDLVRQLLAFSRKQTLEFKSIDLNSLLTDFEKLLRRTIREDIDIDIVRTDPLPLIKGDVGQLEQVVMNLAVNAQDAMPEGGNLTLETARVDLDENYAAQHDGVEPGPYVALAVSDTGCGMDEKTREQLFEPFFTTKEKDKGTGLGLATVYGVVKQHGGNIWVYSEPGQGSTFKVYLPVSEETEIQKKKDRKTVKDLKGSETVLLVEDNEEVRNLAVAILKREGYTVLVAESGREALAVLDSHKATVRLLLTDVVMPEINGKELYRRVSESCPNIKALYMSGYTDNVIAHHGVLDKGVHFIQKPFSVKALAEKVRDVLEEE